MFAGRVTSISLEDLTPWSLRNEGSDFANLSSAIRMFVLRYYRDKLDRQEQVVVLR
jgi:predicted DNA-binding ribbon-helix-helix protein